MNQPSTAQPAPVAPPMGKQPVVLHVSPAEGSVRVDTTTFFPDGREALSVTASAQGLKVVTSSRTYGRHGHLTQLGGVVALDADARRRIALALCPELAAPPLVSVPVGPLTPVPSPT